MNLKPASSVQDRLEMTCRQRKLILFCFQTGQYDNSQRDCVFKPQCIGHNALKISCHWEDNRIRRTVSITWRCIFLFSISKIFQIVSFTWFEMFYLGFTRQLWGAPMLLALRLLLIFLSSDSRQALYCSLLIQDDTILPKPLHCITTQGKCLFTFLLSCHLMFTQL